MVRGVGEMTAKALRPFLAPTWLLVDTFLPPSTPHSAASLRRVRVRLACITQRTVSRLRHRLRVQPTRESERALPTPCMSGGVRFFVRVDYGRTGATASILE